MITSKGLKKQFEDSKKSQARFALDCGVDASRFNKILKGHGIRISELNRFCEGLGCQPADLIEWEEA